MAGKHLVVDQNAFQAERLLEEAIANVRAHGDQLLVPDMALAEMMKGPRWEASTRQTLACLSRHDPQLVVVARAPGELMSEEFSTGLPAQDLIDWPVTTSFRSLLSEVRNGSGPILSHIRAAIVAAQHHADRQHFDHVRNRERVARMVEAWKEEASAEELKAVRRGSPADEGRIRELLGSDALTKTCAEALCGAGYDEDKALRLATTRSVSGHTFYGLASLSLRWLHGGLDCAKDGTITNDVSDLDYVVMASLCRGIVSRETLVRAHDDRLRAVSEIRQANCEAIWASVQPTPSASAPALAG